MQIYIASSWKNQLAVELLTERLREFGAEVLSFVENNHGEQGGHLATIEGKPQSFEQWVWSERGERSFNYDTGGASKADLVIYIGPSGADAWCEVGIAWRSGIPVLGFWAKGDQIGLMRRVPFAWFDDAKSLLTEARAFIRSKKAEAA